VRYAVLVCPLVAGILLAFPADARLQPSRIDEFVSWLDDPERQWLATAELQRIPDAAVARLLEPERLVLGPHGSMTASLLTLAKIGEPAIPATLSYVRELSRSNARDAMSYAYSPIEVLRRIGPAAAPALLEIATLGGPTDGSQWNWALEALAAMEPRTSQYGQILSPWSFWQPADDRQPRLDRMMGALLPRIEDGLNLRVRQSDPSVVRSSRAAAYLLARWGSPSQRARGLQMLEDLARSSTSYDAVEVLRTLFVLKAPTTPALIHLTAPRIPLENDLRAAHFLSMAISLQQLGQRDYGPLVDDAIRFGRPVDRLEAADFLGKSEDFANVPRLVALLDEATVWSGRTVAAEALRALNRLTLQDLTSDRSAWNDWESRHRGIAHRAVFASWIADAEKAISKVPIWTANAWMGKIRWTGDPRVLLLVDAYLRRPDLEASKTGPNISTGGGGDGPDENRAPDAVSLLLRLAQLGNVDALRVLETSLRAADPEVRWYGAMALAAYRPRQAADSLVVELLSPNPFHRSKVSELLLKLGDARGIPGRIEAFESGGAIFGYGVRRDGDAGDSQAKDMDRDVRMFACRDLRVYTQQPLPCDPKAIGDDLTAQVSRWRTWWNSSRATFAVRSREARLDLESMYRVRPVTIGEFVVR